PAELFGQVLEWSPPPHAGPARPFGQRAVHYRWSLRGCQRQGSCHISPRMADNEAGSGPCMTLPKTVMPGAMVLTKQKSSARDANGTLARIGARTTSSG